jgi:signal transduction histidine kinase
VIGTALLVGFLTLAAGIGGALAISRLPSLRLQLTGLALLATLLPLAAVAFSGVMMFESEHDLVVLGAAIASAAAAIAGALLVRARIMGRLDRLRHAASMLAAGDLSARAPADGPSEVAQLGSAFNEMAGRVEELFDARRQLVAWASHDLRTPLASLQAMIEAVEDGVVPAEHYLPAMRERVRTLGTLIDDLFELARIDAGALTVELRTARVEPLVATCMRGIEEEARSKHVDISTTISPDLPPIRCAPETVERVLLNLLTNALRHTPSDGTVAVIVAPEEPQGEALRVIVEDSGEGIPAGQLGNVFERFWRADRARSGGGAGLGLAIARGLVEANGGRIWAEHRPGGGARVVFTLPVAAGAAS